MPDVLTAPSRAAALAPLVVGLGVGSVVAGSAWAQLGRGDLFQNGLDTTFDSTVYTQTFHDERFAPNTGASDQTVLFGVDYAGFTGLAAPGSVNSFGLAVIVNGAENAAGEVPERVGLNVHPNVSIDSSATDWVMTVNAFAFNIGGPDDTTLAYVAGLSASGTRTNWQGGTDTDGLFWSLTTDAKATNDLLSFGGNPGSPATSFQVNDIDGNPVNTDRPTPGTAGQWTTLAVGSFGNTPFFAVRTHQPDGTPNAWEVIESYDNTAGPTVGMPFFGVEDPFNSHNGSVGVAFDNVTISTLRAGDTNFDGDVDFRDAVALRRAFSGADIAADVGGAVAPGFDADLWLWTLGDFDADRDVDFADALALVGNYDGRANSSSFDAPSFPLTLEVDPDSGAMRITGDTTTLDGISISSASGSLAGSEAAFDLALASDTANYTALSLEGLDLDEPLDLGLTYHGAGDDLTFSYGVGGEAFVGEVRYVPEPTSVALVAGAVVLFRRASRRRRG